MGSHTSVELASLSPLSVSCRLPSRGVFLTAYFAESFGREACGEEPAHVSRNDTISLFVHVKYVLGLCVNSPTMYVIPKNVYHVVSVALDTDEKYRAPKV